MANSKKTLTTRQKAARTGLVAIPLVFALAAGAAAAHNAPAAAAPGNDSPEQNCALPGSDGVKYEGENGGDAFTLSYAYEQTGVDGDGKPIYRIVVTVVDNSADGRGWDSVCAKIGGPGGGTPGYSGPVANGGSAQIVFEGQGNPYAVSHSVAYGGHTEPTPTPTETQTPHQFSGSPEYDCDSVDATFGLTAGETLGAVTANLQYLQGSDWVTVATGSYSDVDVGETFSLAYQSGDVPPAGSYRLVISDGSQELATFAFAVEAQVCGGTETPPPTPTPVRTPTPVVTPVVPGGGDSYSP